MFTVTVQAQDTLVLNLDTIAGDNTVNIAEKTAGFTISGSTGTESGVSVSVPIGLQPPLTTTSVSNGAWSVSVPPAASYITGTSVAVTVSASKTGFTAPNDVTRSLTVDLTAPSVSYTAPSPLKVGVAVSAMSPTTSDTDIDSYSASGLPSGLSINPATGVISGTPDRAASTTASATVTVTDTASNPAEVSITFPTVAKGDQTLTGFAYNPATVKFGDTAPTLTEPTGAVGALSYTTIPLNVCTVNSGTGALTLLEVGACEITATAASNNNYNEATDMFTVTVQAQDTLVLNLDTIAGDNTVNIAEKTAGFTISGSTGTESGVSVSVPIGLQSPLTTTSVSNGAWSVSVPPAASYITGTSVAVTVSASKTGFTAPNDETRSLAVDLTAPSVIYTAPSPLKVGMAIIAMSPTTSDTDIDSYSASGLPSGLSIDTTGVISGTPDSGRVDHRERHGNGDRHGRQHRHDIDHVPGGSQGGPDADGVPVQRLLGGVRGHGADADGAHGGGGRAVVHDDLTERVHGELDHGRVDDRGGGQLRDHRHGGIKQQLQRGNGHVHGDGAGGRHARAEPGHDAGTTR